MTQPDQPKSEICEWFSFPVPDGANFTENVNSATLTASQPSKGSE